MNQTMILVGILSKKTRIGIDYNIYEKYPEYLDQGWMENRYTR